MKFTILGQGTAVPEHSADRSESIDIAMRHFCNSDQERRLITGLYRMTGVEKRHSVLLHKRLPEHDGPQYDLLYPPKDGSDMGPSIGARMEVYE